MKRERGFALLIVLWSLVLITLLTIQILASGRSALALAGNIRAAAAARAAADGAISEAVYHVLAYGPDHWAVDGAPRLESRRRYVGWAHVLGDEYRVLGERLHAGRDSDIDAYGETSPAEFFAVVTEMFFERPGAMKTRHAALYAELAEFYGQDPATLESP